MDEIEISKLQTSHALMDCLAHEWLEVNGLGSYSSSSILNCHTRKYHGLLVSELTTPPGKFVLLSNLIDEIIMGDNVYPLTVYRYADVIQQSAFDYFSSFRLGDYPCFCYQDQGILITKSILLVDKEETVLIKYTITTNRSLNESIKLNLQPLLAYRDFHSLTQANANLCSKITACQSGFQITPYEGMPTFFIQSSVDFSFNPNSDWYHGIFYAEDKARGCGNIEDLFTPGMITIDLSGCKEVIISGSLVEQPNSDSLREKWDDEVIYRRKTRNGKGSSLQKKLQVTSNSFFKHFPDGSLSITAGYHWFLEWGRDAMVALPGLTLYQNEPELCLRVLKYFAQYENEGLIPNFIGKVDEKEIAYNGVDSSLWFVWATQQYFAKTKDLLSIKNYLWGTIKKVFEHYCSGIGSQIIMKENGLLWVDARSNGLTWMDAQVNGKPVTPRNGMQVEVNALWYNLICFIEELGIVLGDPVAKKAKSLRQKVISSFRLTFWDDAQECLRDFVNEEQKNSSIRPNQIFAVSLPFSPLTLLEARKVVAVVKEHLFTPVGLRSLSPQDPSYVGHYQGNIMERDLIYHQGTVWPWLLAHFGEALIKTSISKQKVLAILQPCLDAFELHLRETGIGTISEIFDGDYPHNPRGAISQAWSVAEILRLTYLIDEINKKGYTRS